MLVYLSNRGLLFIGYDILRGNHEVWSQEKNNLIESFLYTSHYKLLLKATEDISFFLLRFITASCIAFSNSKSYNIDHDVHTEVRASCLDSWGHYFKSILLSLWSLRAASRIFSGNFSEELSLEFLMLLDFCEYYVHFSAAWFQRNSKGLLLLVQPLIVTFTNGHTPYDVDMVNLKNAFSHVADLVTNKLSVDSVEGACHDTTCFDNKNGGDLKHSIPVDERWPIMGVCLWQHMSRFLKHKLVLRTTRLDDYNFSGLSYGNLPSWLYRSTSPDSSSISISDHVNLLSLVLVKLLNSTLSHICSYHLKQLAFILQQKLENGLDVPTCRLLEESSQSQPRVMYQHLSQSIASTDIMNKDEVALSEFLWEVCADTCMITEGFAQEKLTWPHDVYCKPFSGWSEINKGVRVDHGTKVSSTSTNGEIVSTDRSYVRGPTSFSSSTIPNEAVLFQSPEEIYKRNGKLFEVALSSN